MPFCVVGRWRASLCATYHHRLGQPPISNHSFRLPGKRSRLVEERREQQLCNSNSPPQQVRPWVCCMLHDTANVETTPNFRA